MSCSHCGGSGVVKTMDDKGHKSTVGCLHCRGTGLYFAGDYIQRLLSVTEGCRDDMHEPDEQGLDMEYVEGMGFDNAFSGPEGGAGIYLIRDRGERREWFNLACLIAVTRALATRGRLGMQIQELIENLQRFPQDARVHFEHCYQDEKGFVKWDGFRLLSIEGNEDDPSKSEDVTIWIKPKD